MTPAPRRCLVFACGHLCDERLFAPQVADLQADHDCRVFVFRDHDSLGAMADTLLAAAPTRFTFIGLSMGGYLAFEIIRRALPRIERLVLMDTSAAADLPARREARLADIAKVQKGGMAALIPELPARWLLPAHQQRGDLRLLMAEMASSVGEGGQFRQQTAMLARPDSHADLARVRVPTLVMCGAEDPVTPPATHQAMAACVPGSQLACIEHCGHLSTIEQPAAVTRLLREWLHQTDAACAAAAST